MNLASRLENLNKDYNTTKLVSHTTYLWTKNKFLYRPVDRVAVKGRVESTLVYELLGQLSSVAPRDHEFARSTTQVFDSYAAGDFEESKSAGRTHLGTYPDDGVVSVLVARSEHLIANPPYTWDGTTMKSQKSC